MPKIELAHRWNGKPVGSTVEVDDDTAQMLVRSGRGRPANKTSAKAVGVELPATADKKES